MGEEEGSYPLPASPSVLGSALYLLAQADTLGLLWTSVFLHIHRPVQPSPCPSPSLLDIPAASSPRSQPGALRAQPCPGCTSVQLKAQP